MAARLIDSSTPDPDTNPNPTQRNEAAGHLVTHSNYRMQPRQRRNIALTLLQVQAEREGEERERGAGEALPLFEEFIRSEAQLEKEQEPSGFFFYL